MAASDEFPQFVEGEVETILKKTPTPNLKSKTHREKLTVTVKREVKPESAVTLSYM